MENKLNLFISYRRADSADFAGRLHDALFKEFNVFLDTEGGIGYGETFPTVLVDEIRKCDIFLMIIGSKCCDEFQVRNKQVDFVLDEIVNAKKFNCNIIPILMDGVTMPNCLPPSIEFVMKLNAYEFRHSKFSLDLEGLKREMKKEIVFQKRYKEIEDYTTTNNLNEATLRLMDFSNDFSEDRKRKNEAKDIRAKFNAFNTEEKKSGFSESLINQYSQLRYQIFNLIENIEIEFTKKESIDNEIKIPKIAVLDSFFKAKEEFQENNNEINIVFNANQITKDYKKKKLMQFSLKPIDLTLKYGEITALVGENGSGKTTLLNMVAGELLHNSGEIEYPALESKKDKTDYYHIKTQIAYVPQEIEKWRGLVVDNLHYTLAINGVKGQENIDEVDFILHRLGLEKFIDAKWKEISGGYKMRFSLAKAILKQPRLLILDEPLSHLDINSSKIFLNDIKNIISSSKYKMSAIISSQHIYELEEIANNIVFLKEGKTLYNGSIKAFRKNRERNTYELNVDIEVNKLAEILSTINDVKIEVTGENYIIEVPLNIKEKEFIQILWDNNLEFKYFRNISQSTRILFMKDEK